MADVTPKQGEGLQADIRTRYKDMQDTTHALVTATRSFGEYGEYGMDHITSARVVIDVAHHEIHEGETWLVSYKSPDADPIADNGTIAFVVVTGSKYVHLLARAGCGGDAEAELYEGTNYQVGTGTAMVERNKSRPTGDGGNTAQVIRQPAINNAGVLLENEFIPGGTGPQAVGGAGTMRAEWVFARNTNYMVRITNRAGNAQPMSLAIEWYEESTN